jgi:hypothetical protein
MNNSKIDMNFPITVYGNLQKFTDTMSIGRVRIFYKYGNRNGTYITDEFAEGLIKTLPYTPVKGIYEVDDYTDHGTKREEGRIYGIVPGPQDMNFAWEKHVDEDGVEREYACVNVYYYTALYEEAGEIDGKGQSMELYRKTIVGNWKVIDGRRWYVFEKGSFLGLQVLGDDVEPCFEGAAFFSLYESVKDLCEKLEAYQSNFQNYGEGGNTMPTLTFKVSDSQKYNFLWALLNPNCNEENNWAVEYGICDIYDEYAIVRNYAEGVFERVYYTKNDETDSLEITSKERCYIVDVNENEKKALEALHALNNNTYEAIDENFTNMVTELQTANDNLTAANATIEECDNTISSLSNEISFNNTKIEELGSENATLIQEKNDAVALHTAATEQIASIQATLDGVNATLATVTAERDTLATFKKNIEDEEKKTLINGYSEQLPEEIIESYINNMDNYSLADLDMKLTYELKINHPEIFSKGTPPAYIPKDSGSEGGLNAILAKYKK